ncbi:MAG: DUF547 domain-containing protein [Nitrospinaceae bacterium]
MKKSLSAIAAGLVFPVLFAVSQAQAFDFPGWDALLKKYAAPAVIDGVRLNGLDYRQLKSDPEFPKLVDGLKSVSPGDLKSVHDKLSFWINVYNILAVKTVLDNYPVDSIKDVGSIFKSVWKRDAGVVAGKMRTLHEIEHEILRKMGEPRIHVAIVCASVSCPDLPPDAFAAQRLDDQLDTQMKAFLENQGKGMRVDREKKKIYLSSIFDWFEDDFEPKGGVREFISRYVSPEHKKLLGDPKVKISYLDYNWKVNEIKRR